MIDWRPLEGIEAGIYPKDGADVLLYRDPLHHNARIPYVIGFWRGLAWHPSANRVIGAPYLSYVSHWAPLNAPEARND